MNHSHYPFVNQFLVILDSIRFTCCFAFIVVEAKRMPRDILWFSEQIFFSAVLLLLLYFEALIAFQG